MRGGSPEKALVTLAVSYHVLARAALGLTDLDEAAELHADGTVTDEVVLFVAECGQGFRLDLKSLLPSDAVRTYMDVLSRLGGIGFHGLDPVSLPALLIVMSGLAESDLRGLEGASTYRLELVELVIAPLVGKLRSTSDDCALLLAGALESLIEMEKGIHR